ncbi:MAG: hypothetical protein DRP29_00895 [Thermodesulfobacteriota bacterium]|nr:MAG: hypothetical protein DRP29_00895 [Thermodesulfobacteriota bacterium]
MIITVPKGTYQIIKGQSNISLKSEFLGSGIGIGIIDLKNEIGGLACYIFPYKKYDMEINESYIFSGESLIPIFLEELVKYEIDFSSSKIVIAGASVYKNKPEFLDIGEKNYKIVKEYFEKFDIKEENIIEEIGLSSPVYIEINLKEKIIKINAGYLEKII